MSLRIALLGLLAASGPASGYDLAKRFENSINHVWHAGHSQIYPELVKMTADGLITVEAEGPRGRKIYAITPQGRTELHSWLLEYDREGPVRNEWALQAFLVSALPPAEAIQVIERIRGAFERRLNDLRSRYEHKLEYGDPDGFGKYALDMGLRQTQTMIAWADATIADLRARLTRGD
ncbi:PadR family transcriptional regulator [Thermopolyspora sp. NPDC052614]|uniref:PadR family transcriptional regulator n=1 Tax=Thermopolyspora sp. NPDC052614 TaxID=3155682 RepID=UPI003446E3C2